MFTKGWEAQDRVRKALSKHGSLSWTRLETETGLVPRVLSEALQALEAKGFVVRGKKRTYQLPNDPSNFKDRPRDHTQIVANLLSLARDGAAIVQSSSAFPAEFIESYDTVSLGNIVELLFYAFNQPSKGSDSENAQFLREYLQNYVMVAVKNLSDFWAVTPEYKEAHNKIMASFSKGYQAEVDGYLKNRLVLEPVKS